MSRIKPSMARAFGFKTPMMRQWHQFYATVDLFQLREVQVFCLGVALVIGGLALLSGAAVHQAWKL